jgi:hypothetical protein
MPKLYPMGGRAKPNCYKLEEFHGCDLADRSPMILLYCLGRESDLKQPNGTFASARMLKCDGAFSTRSPATSSAPV